MNYNKLKELFSSPKKIVITTHKSPDGDALGSSLGLFHVLKQFSHHISVIVPNEYPDFLKWMPGNNEVLIFEENPENCIPVIQNAEVIFCLDFNTLSRISDMQNHVASSKAVKILIDHHQQPDEFDFMLSDTSASSTSQLVYDFIENMGWKNNLTQESAECLYAGIMTDTGSFRFPSTSARTHEIVAEMKQNGLQHDKIHINIYDTFSIHRIKLLGFALTERLDYLPEHQSVIIYLSEEDLKNYKYQTGDTEGLVNYGLSIKNVNFVALVKEWNGIVKLSFRSKGKFDVNQFARNYFNGGGHKNAAGGNSQLNVKETVARIRELIKKHHEEIITAY
ncbi:MAG: bifunctional oligoribonuclease/PAP phosphatase NrnA [Bacteroidetes bacterium]|nr:MAG: bifunctional oligoribonuclease/PAP phosphatase NrnA [Bacteroidota bacterium]